MQRLGCNRHIICHLFNLKVIIHSKTSLMKNDKSTIDLVSPKKLTFFQKLTSFCDYHKLIVINCTLTLFKYYTRYRIVHSTTKRIWDSLVSNTKPFFRYNSKKNVSGLAYQGNFAVNHMAQWNLFDVVNSVILKFPADDL